MAPNTFTTPYDYAASLLALVEAAVAETAAGAIDRAYVAPGLPAIDCATIAVTLEALGEAALASPGALTAGHRHRLAAVNLLGFSVTLARDCVPVADGRSAQPPRPDQLSAAAAIVVEDVWAVWNAITEAMAAGELFEGRCHELFMDGAAALATSGMTAGFVLGLRTAIGGIPRGAPPTPPPSLYTESLFDDVGPLTDPWSSLLVLGHSGPFPEVTLDGSAHIVQGLPATDMHSIQRPDLGVGLNGIAGVRLHGDWAAADPTNALVAVTLYIDDLNYYEVAYYPTGGCICTQVTAGEGEEIWNTMIMGLGDGAAIGLLHDSGVLQALISPTGDLTSLFAVAAQEIAMSLPGDLAPAFAVASDVAIDMMFTRSL